MKLALFSPSARQLSPASLLGASRTCNRLFVWHDPGENICSISDGVRTMTVIPFQLGLTLEHHLKTSFCSHDVFIFEDYK